MIAFSILIAYSWFQLSSILFCNYTFWGRDMIPHVILFFFSENVHVRWCWCMQVKSMFLTFIFCYLDVVVIFLFYYFRKSSMKNESENEKGEYPGKKKFANHLSVFSWLFDLHWYFITIFYEIWIHIDINIYGKCF